MHIDYVAATAFWKQSEIGMGFFDCTCLDEKMPNHEVLQSA